MASILKVNGQGDGMPTADGSAGRHPSLKRKRTADTDTAGSTRASHATPAVFGAVGQETDDPPITEILASGEASALDALIPRIYATLHQLARRQLAHEQSHTLGTTALVHEVYLQLAIRDAGPFVDREHFYAYISRAMRHLLIDRARRKRAQKRQAPEMTAAIVPSGIIDVLALDEALTQLAALDERLARIAEMRLFAELSSTEIAAIIGTTSRTVERGWLKARTFLSLCLRPGE